MEVRSIGSAKRLSGLASCGGGESVRVRALHESAHSDARLVCMRPLVRSTNSIVCRNLICRPEQTSALNYIVCLSDKRHPIGTSRVECPAEEASLCVRRRASSRKETP